MNVHDIVETVRPFRLYHATGLDRLYEILDSNEIADNTTHRIDTPSARDQAFRKSDADSRGYVFGVSLTRNPRFAHRWQSNAITGQRVVLVLDGEALKQRFRIIPLAFFGGRHRRWPPEGPARSDESEEFVIGPIKPLKPYLIELQVTQQTLRSDDLLRFAAAEFAVHLVVVNDHAPQFG